MTQATYTMANAVVGTFLPDLNNHLAAIVSNNSGSSEPGTTFAGQFWFDSTATPWTLKVRSHDDASWASLFKSDGTIVAAPAAHVHSSLAASDGSPDPALSVDADGNVVVDTGSFGIGVTPEVNRLFQVHKATGPLNIKFDIDDSGDVVFEFETSENNWSMGISGGDFKIRDNTSGLNLLVLRDNTMTINNFLFVDDDKFSINDVTPKYRFATKGSQTDGYFGVSNTGDGDIFSIDAAGNVVVGAGDVEISVGGFTVAGDITSTGDIFILDASGLVVGHTAKVDFGATPEFQILGTATPDSSMGFARFENNASGPDFRFLKSRGATIGTNVIVQDGDTLGRIRFQAADGGDFNTPSVQIHAEVDGAPGLNDMPGRLIFSTTADGASNVTERMRIDSAGNVIIAGHTSSASMEISGTRPHSSVKAFINESLYFDSDRSILFNAYFDSTFKYIEDGSAYRVRASNSGYRWYTGPVNASGAGAALTLTQRMILDLDGNLGIGTASPTAKLHVDQSSATAAIPVLILDQADDSEEMIEFVATVGAGNPIEVVGIKTLTTTHFVRVSLPGGLARYMPVGTIA